MEQSIRSFASAVVKVTLGGEAAQIWPIFRIHDECLSSSLAVGGHGEAEHWLPYTKYSSLISKCKNDVGATDN